MAVGPLAWSWKCGKVLYNCLRKYATTIKMNFIKGKWVIRTTLSLLF